MLHARTFGTHERMHAHLVTAVKQLQSEGMFNSLLKM